MQLFVDSIWFKVDCSVKLYLKHQLIENNENINTFISQWVKSPNSFFSMYFYFTITDPGLSQSNQVGLY